MGRYRLELRSSVEKDLLSITKKKERQRVVRRIGSLADNPRPYGSQKLGGTNLYRVRQGDLRIVYEIHDARLVVLIVRVGHRSRVHRTT